jgi:hypothetical protein
MVWLVLWLVSIIIAEAVFSAAYYPRHLYIVATPISILLGYYLTRISNNLLLFCLFSALIFIPTWRFNYLLLSQPHNAPLAGEDIQQFYQDWSAGAGNNQIAQRIKSLSVDQDIAVFFENEPHQGWLFENFYNLGGANVIPDDQIEIGDLSRVIEYHNRNPYKTIYIVLNRNPKAPDHWPVKLVYSTPKGPSRTINLYQLDLKIVTLSKNSIYE